VVCDNTSAPGHFHCKGKAAPNENWGGNWGSPIKALFWIAVSNCATSVMPSVTQLIIIWSSKDNFNVAPIYIANLFVEVLLLAAV
jgi:hypothetical protein